MSAALSRALYPEPVIDLARPARERNAFFAGLTVGLALCAPVWALLAWWVL